MSVFAASLNSGSNGNCYYIGTDKAAVLIDAGISCKETEKRLKRLGLPMERVKAVFISHEHIDHVKGIEVLAKRYDLPVFATPATFGNTHMKPPAHLIRTFTAHQPVTIAGITVTGFPKWHDAIDPHSFIVSAGDINVGVFTDIGAPCAHVVSYFSKCHAAFLEANYDDDMLANGRYPYNLKKRISGDKGHMSNAQAAALFQAHRPPFMSHLWMAHLSKDNNNPELALAAMQQQPHNVAVSVASRYLETELFQVTATPVVAKHIPKKAVQASLFN